MKSKLPLFVSLLIAISGYTQTINSFYSANDTPYTVVTGSIDQSASGASTSWNFSNLVATGTINTDAHTPATITEAITYFGTTTVSTITPSPSGSTVEIYTKDAANAISITGAVRDGLDLNYISDNAFIGTFPLSFGYSNTDDVAGSFSYSIASGSFSGTMTTEVDASGTLSIPDVGEGAYIGNVTRLKTMQSLSLTISILPVGTATQTTYNYYDNSSGALVFRSTTVTINVTILGNVIIYDETIMESYTPSTLNISETTISDNYLNIYPNPVNRVLNLDLNNNTIIKNISISDITGRQVLNKKSTDKTLSVDQLKAGIYILSVTTDSGIISKKFIKQ